MTLPTEAEEPNRPTARQVASLVEWNGPLPPPAALQAFEDIAPGTAERIVGEFVAEAHHRRAQERKQGNLIFLDNVIGRLLAIAFAAGGFWVTYQAIVHNSPWVGGIVGGGMIVAGMTVLIRGRA